MNNNNSQQTTATPLDSTRGQWRGMTLEELQRARAKALIKRELGRANMQNNIDGVKTNVANNGVRALMFNSNQVAHLRTADYLLLGFKLSRWLLSLRSNRRSRRR